MDYPRRPRASAGSPFQFLLMTLAVVVVGLLSRNANAGALTIAPSSATVAPTGSQMFTASGGSGMGYTWSLSMNLSGGSITPAGLYTAGATSNVVDQVQLTDTPVGDAAPDIATANVTVGAGLVVMPLAVTVPAGGMQTFVVSGGTPPYTWALTTNGSGSMASVSPMGVYTAGILPGTDVVTVTDSTGKTAMATVTVTVMRTGIGSMCMISATCPVGASCVDGVCCTTACSGQCQACNTASSMGTCVTISGPPVGTRTACPQSDPKNVCTSLACDGTNPTTCTVFVGSTMTCGIPSCIDGVGTPGAVCEADGGCQVVAPQSCGKYACVSSACASSCTNSSDCASGNYCEVNSGKCIVPLPVPDAGGNNGTSTPSGASAGGCAMTASREGWAPLVGLAALVGSWGLWRRRRRG